MPHPIYHIDAFTDHLFGGNPAAVIPLLTWLPDQTLQAIAAENNLSETAFYAPEGDHFRLRWFTPKVEVDLCGHATLAAANVLFRHEGFSGDRIHFESRSGTLYVRKKGDLYELDFPADVPQPIDPPAALIESLGLDPMEAWQGRDDWMLVYATERLISNFDPDFQRMTRASKRGVVVTAPGDEVDFVSRFFAPNVGIPEDPVTGSAHTLLTPYWSKRLGKSELKARQISQRVGSLQCRLDGDRVLIAGQAVTYLIGQISL
ncbi:MAG: PhzF family phenazine biosynthesis protein [bacterium]|nr:PhzF family phenazine biosynthesis protein [bacterium]